MHEFIAGGSFRNGVRYGPAGYDWNATYYDIEAVNVELAKLQAKWNKVPSQRKAKPNRV